MDIIVIFALIVFFLVAATVYAVLVLQRDRNEEEESVSFQGSWSGFQSEGGTADIFKSSGKGEGWKHQVKERVKRWRGGGASAETETLYFVLQFLMYVESGMIIMNALQKTQAAMEAAGYRLAEDLGKINFRLRGGMPFDEAIAVLDGNGRGKALREFFLVISQAQQVGVPIADALKGAIKEYEELRVINAETRASKLSVLMVIPIAFGFLPSIMVLVGYPAVTNLIKAFK